MPDSRFNYLLTFLLFIGCRKADFKMDVDGELGLESGNNVDRFTLLRPVRGVEEKGVE